MDYLSRYSSLACKTPPASHGDFIATPGKQTSWNSCKNLSTVQRSDQELWTSWAGTLVWSLVWPDETLGVSSSNFSATPRTIASGKSCRNLSTIQRSDQELRTSWVVLLCGPWSCPTRRCRCRVSILVGRQEKLSPKTTVKTWARSNGRIKSYGLFEQVL
jgi:hypothetical protein